MEKPKVLEFWKSGFNFVTESPTFASLDKFAEKGKKREGGTFG